MPQLSVEIRVSLNFLTSWVVFTWGLLFNIFHTLLGGVYLSFFLSFIPSWVVYIWGLFFIFYTLLAAVYLRVTFNFFYTLLGTVHLRVTFNLFYTLWVEYTWELFSTVSYTH